jgi:hypothetical protein
VGASAVRSVKQHAAILLAGDLNRASEHVLDAIAGLQAGLLSPAMVRDLMAKHQNAVAAFHSCLTSLLCDDWHAPD